MACSRTSDSVNMHANFASDPQVVKVFISGSEARIASVEYYRSFTVASAIAASIALISQNRTTTCDSVHPLR